MENIVKDIPDVINVKCTDCTDLFEGRVDENHLLSALPLSGKKMIMPSNVNGNHWCLLFADFGTKTFLFLDPLLLRSETKFMQSFIYRISELIPLTKENIDMSDWKTPLIPKFPKQTNDHTNCGIYVVLYAQVLVDKLSLRKFPDPSAYRLI